MKLNETKLRFIITVLLLIVFNVFFFLKVASSEVIVRYLTYGMCMFAIISTFVCPTVVNSEAKKTGTSMFFLLVSYAYAIITITANLIILFSKSANVTFTIKLNLAALVLFLIVYLTLFLYVTKNSTPNEELEKEKLFKSEASTKIKQIIVRFNNPKEKELLERINTRILACPLKVADNKREFEDKINYLINELDNNTKEKTLSFSELELICNDITNNIDLRNS